MLPRRLLRSTRGTMALTLSQAFLGAITVGIGLSRGIESDLSFHVEGLTAEANYAASRVAAGHAKASNAIADDNVLSAAAMGPRLAVEADNITMDENAKIACPRQSDAKMKQVCDEYTKNKPRAGAKLAWIREKQSSLWGSLEKLSGAMDKVAGAHGREDVQKTLGSLDPGARVRFDDPTESKEIWGSRSASTGCSIAKKDAIDTAMVGHAFPLLMPNLLEGLPRSLVSALPSALCPETSRAGGGGGGGAGGGAGASGGPPTLGDVPTVNEEADKECERIEENMRAQIAYASSSSSPSKGAMPAFSSDVEPFVKCAVATMSAPAKSDASSGTFVIRRGGQLVTCAFDRAECSKKKLESGSADFLKKLGLPKVPSFEAIGGSTRGPSAANPNESDDFRASASVERPVNSGTADIADAARAVMSFGGVEPSTTLRENAQRTATGKWYFPTGAGSPLAGVPRDQQGFVSGWKHSLVAGRSAGRP